MGVNLGDIAIKSTIKLSDLKGKAIAIDAYNAIYQFLSIIRGFRGEPLRDRFGRVTSHLCGLLYRNCNLLEIGIKPAYVFDGAPPSLKEAEIKLREKSKEEAMMKYVEALRKGDLERARMYAQATAKLRDEMVEESKKLLTLMGIPWVQAPSEGEAQAARMSARGDVWASASQDYDSLLFGATRLVRNLAITGRRKLPRKKIYVKVLPEIVELEDVLTKLGITREQLVDIGILIGTDFNPGGVKGIGPKKALELVKTYGSLEGILPTLKGVEFPVDPSEIREIFLNPNVTDDYELRWVAPDVDRVVEFLCRERDFNEERVRKALEKALTWIEKEAEAPKLEAFF